MPSAAAWRETICLCPSDGKVSQYLGAGKAILLFVAAAHAGLTDLTLLDDKYEAVKEDLEVQEREILLWQSQVKVHAQLQPRPQKVSCDSASQSDSSRENLAV